MPKKIPIVRVGILLLAASFVVLYLFFGFRGSFERCDENHSAVRRMRAMTQDQLAALYDRVMQLPDQYLGERLGTGATEIPKDLAYLKAVYMHVGSKEVFVPLDKCNVSVGVGLHFWSSDYPPKRIELWWDEPSEGAPYERAREVLWSE